MEPSVRDDFNLSQIVGLHGTAKATPPQTHV
jgi:hypothetical protein